MSGPLLALQLGYGPLAVGLLVSCFAMVGTVFAVHFGSFADDFGLQRPWRRAVFLACSAGSLAALFPDFSVLCGAAMLAGSASGLALVTVQRHVSRMPVDTDAQRTQLFGWVSIAPPLGNFVGPLLVGGVIDAIPDLGWGGLDQIGFRCGFFVLASLPLLGWILVRPLPEAPRAFAVDTHRRQQAWHLLRNSKLRNLLLVNGCVQTCWDLHTVVVPMLAHSRGLSASATGMLLSIFALASAFSRPLLPKLLAGVLPARVIAWALSGVALLFAVYPWTPNVWMMGVCSFLLGGVIGSMQPMILSTLHRITPSEQQGQALGLRLMSINTFSLAMPLTFGVVSGWVGVSGLFWLVVGGVLVGRQLSQSLCEETTSQPG